MKLDTSNWVKPVEHWWSLWYFDFKASPSQGIKTQSSRIEIWVEGWVIVWGNSVNYFGRLQAESFG